MVRVVDLNEGEGVETQGSLQFLHELSCTKTVDDTVVAGQAHLHDGADDDLAVAYDGHLLRPCDGEDSGVRLIDDRGEGLDTIHTQVGDSEGATFLILRRKLLTNSTLGDVLETKHQVYEAKLLCPMNDRHQKAFIHTNRHSEVHIVMKLNLRAISRERSIDIGVIHQRAHDSDGDDIRDGKLLAGLLLDRLEELLAEAS